MEFTPEQYRAMRFQLDRAEEQALRAGRAVDWLIDPNELQSELARMPVVSGAMRNTLTRSNAKRREQRFGDFQHSAFEVLS